MQEENSKNKLINKLKIIQYLFWITFVVIWFVSGYFTYHWLPNESPMLSNGEVMPPYEILSSHEVCSDSDVGGSCGTVADVWRNTKTGKEYSKYDFKEHKDSENIRLLLVRFFYGLIACFFIASIQHYKGKDFFRYLGIAVLVNIVIGFFFYGLSV